MTKTKDILYYVALGLVVILGVALRLNLFVSSGNFEDDECRLILTMLDKNLWQMFLPLGDAQSAPPVFLLIGRFVSGIFGYNEYALKFISLAANIGAAGVLYLICSEFFKKRISVVLSLFIYMVSRPVLNFSVTFKQYSFDILICALCFYYLPKINLAKLSLKKTIGLGGVILLLPLISLPSVFFIGAFFIQNLINNFKDKEFYKRFLGIIIPLGGLMLAYFVFNLNPSRIDLNSFFPNYWDDGFWSFTPKSLVRLLGLNYQYDFYPNVLPLFWFILTLGGMFFCLKDRKPMSIFIVITLALCLLASLLHLYPFVGRVGLYFIVGFILLAVKTVDSLNSKAFWAGLVCFFLAFGGYNFSYLNKISKVETFITYAPKNLMMILKEKFNPETDAVLCNSASTSSYLFYSSNLGFDTENIYEMDTAGGGREKIFSYLNNLKKGQKFWLYMVKDYRKNQMFGYVFEWLQEQDVLYSHQERGSYLFYIQN